MRLSILAGRMAAFDVEFHTHCVFLYVPKAHTSTQLEQLTEKIINIISYHKSRLYFYNVCSKDLSQLGLVIFFRGESEKRGEQESARITYNRSSSI